MSVKISIIIPVYNAEKYLRMCLESAVSQTIKEKEIVCIDDGSTDGSFHILKEFQCRYPYVRILRQENKGAGKARNLGLLHAAGKYVCFLDADDFYIDISALEKLVRVCERTGLRVCAGLRKIYEEERLQDFFLYREYFQDEKNKEGIVLRYEDHQDEYYYQNYIFLRETIRENGIDFPPYRRYQDAPFFVKIMAQVREFLVLPVEFYGYRFSEEAYARKGLYIKDTLKGIRDNVLTAAANRLEELNRLLVDRIVREYSRWLIADADQEILDIICSIQKIVFQEEYRKGMKDDQAFSLEIIRLLISVSVKGNSLGDFFANRGVDSVSVYGLGTFGRLTVMEMKKSKKISLYGVDQEERELEGIEQKTLEEANRLSKDIIVTPVIDNENIICGLRKRWAGNVWGLYGLLCKINDLTMNR